MTTFDRDRAATQFIKAAEEDIDASGLLLSQGRFRLATYHLEQATEKALKAYILAHTEIELRKTHNSALLLADFLELSMEQYREPLLAFKQLLAPSLGTEKSDKYLDPDVGQERIRMLQQHSKNTTGLRKAFPSFLEESHRPLLRSMIDGLNKLIGPTMDEQLSVWHDSIRVVLPSLMPGVPAATFSKAVEESRTIHAGALALASLAQLATIFLLHDQDPRYPSMRQPLETSWARYEAGTPLVDALPELLILVTTVHQALAKVIVVEDA